MEVKTKKTKFLKIQKQKIKKKRKKDNNLSFLKRCKNLLTMVDSQKY